MCCERVVAHSSGSTAPKGSEVTSGKPQTEAGVRREPQYGKPRQKRQAAGRHTKRPTIVTDEQNTTPSATGLLHRMLSATRLRCVPPTQVAALCGLHLRYGRPPVALSLYKQCHRHTGTPSVGRAGTGASTAPLPCRVGQVGLLDQPNSQPPAGGGQDAGCCLLTPLKTAAPGARPGCPQRPLGRPPPVRRRTRAGRRTASPAAAGGGRTDRRTRIGKYRRGPLGGRHDSLTSREAGAQLLRCWLCHMPACRC